MLASWLSKFAVAGHPSDGAKTKFPKVPLGGVYPSIRPYGYFSLSASLHITQVVRGWQPSLGTLAHFVLLFSVPIFLRIL